MIAPGESPSKIEPVFAWVLIAWVLILGSQQAMAQAGGPSGRPAGRPQSNPSAPPSVAAPRLGSPQDAAKAENRPPVPPPLVPARTEEGTQEGSSFRIDIPDAWNRDLVVFFHGYEQTPRLFALNTSTGKPNPPSRLVEQLLSKGYAVVQSGYSVGGWAVTEAASEGESLRKYFDSHYGTPQDTYVMGQSMGGLLTVLSLEQHPRAYSGGLSLCGVLAPADLIMQRAFANRVAFDAFFPGILPDVEHIPDNFQMNDPVTSALVEKALDAHPPEAALLRSLADIHTNRGLADVLVFNTFVIKDLQMKAGGNPFDNRNLIYTGTTDDNALNEKVKRYAADDRALNYVAAHYSPSGELTRKLLALHTMYDPLVPAGTAAYYDELTRRLGRGELFVQQYVNRDGHCNITPEQVGEALDELVTWVHGGPRPNPGRLPDIAQQAPPHQVPTPKPAAPTNIGKPR
jgi:pimeloyl-ACP methyl ester carboxylesterase